jgi:hypothetical protein
VRGDHVDLMWEQDAYVFARRHGAEVVLIAINRSHTDRELKVPAARLAVMAGELRPLLGTGHGRVIEDMLVVRVPGELIVPFDVISRR